MDPELNPVLIPEAVLRRGLPHPSPCTPMTGPLIPNQSLTAPTLPCALAPTPPSLSVRLQHTRLGAPS